MKRYKKLNKRKVRVSFLLLFIVLICLVYATNHIRLDNKKTDDNNDNVDLVEAKQEYTISLAMVGDALIHDRLYNDAYKDGHYDFKPYLRLIKDYLKGYDLKYYNQETILGGSSIGLSSYPSFNSPWELGDAMIDTGFNIVSLATNHTLDRGEKAIKLSREYWNKHDNVYAMGSYSSVEEKKKIESMVFDKNNIKYGILNYTYGTNGIPVPYGMEYLVNLWDDVNNYEGYKQKVISDINNLRDKVDVLMVAMHWGREYTHTPTDLERKTAKFLAENGVDIVIGTHPHVIQPVEWIDDTLVIYSLGNFISAQNSESCVNYKCNIGLLSSLTITKTIEDNTSLVKIDNIENELIYTYHNNYQDYLVIPFSNKEIKEYLPDYENVYNNYAKIISSSDERIKTVPLSS